jgi:hypothetical protein
MHFKIEKADTTRILSYPTSFMEVIILKAFLGLKDMEIFIVQFVVVFVCILIVFLFTKIGIIDARLTLYKKHINNINRRFIIAALALFLLELFRIYFCLEFFLFKLIKQIWENAILNIYAVCLLITGYDIIISKLYKQKNFLYFVTFVTLPLLISISGNFIKFFK